MNIDQMHSLRAVSQALESGEVSAKALIERYLERIESTNSTINAYIDVFAESALDQATLSDERRRQGNPRSALDGVAIALKDNIDVEGRVTTNGLDSGPTASRSAPLVRRLEAGGAIMLGKLNMQLWRSGGSRTVCRCIGQ
jgi:aspartyl-tRNA(Asn)/glutamyl-tRNA(Gln) amidotransferase subunit A